MAKEINHVKISYSNCFVAFLDVLGFRKLVFSESQNDKKKLEDYFSIVKEITQELVHIKNIYDLKSITISDSIILSVPFGEDIHEGLSQLRQLCVAVGKIQFKLALENIWLRGGISVGDAYFDQKNNQVVGPAYTKAFLLEETAQYPRVILDNSIVKKLGMETAQNLINSVNDHGNGGLKFSNWPPDKILFEWNDDVLSNKRLTKDIACFIDYLLPASYSTENLVTVISNISDSIYSEAEVYSKYRWVANYLMASLEQTHFPLGPDKLSIPYDWLRGL